MKATGIVRRIDDLGRIVIPKEIRRTLRIREADPLEIYTDREGEIILKKYSPIGEMGTFARQYAESMAQVSGHIALITDRDQFIAVSGGMKNVLGSTFSANPPARIWKKKLITGKVWLPPWETAISFGSATTWKTFTTRPSAPLSARGT